ncbi:MAG: QueT transporter family protein [Candidatus Bathyarchaeia archaeon]
MNIREISLAAVVAALYAALVVVLAPVSFGPVQLRVADCLIPFSALLGWPAVLGVSLGAFLGNTYFMLGVVDIVGGTIANLVAASLIFYLRRRLLPACVVGSIAVGVIVGGYLWIYFPPPSIAGLNLPVWGGMVVSITLSSLIAVAGIGHLLIRALSRSGFAELLESRGVRTYLK